MFGHIRPTTNRDVLHTVSIKIFRSIYLWAFVLRIERQPLHEFCSLSYNYRQWNGENCVGRFHTSVRTWLVIASKVLLLMFYFSNSVNVELDNRNVTCKLVFLEEKTLCFTILAARLWVLANDQRVWCLDVRYIIGFICPTFRFCLVLRKTALTSLLIGRQTDMQ